MGKYCCKKFKEQAELEDRFAIQDDGTWAINGCCGGGCYVVVDMKFCPYCGGKILIRNESLVDHQA